jgi:Leucine-rich repeat (LRR) protein
VSFTVSTNEFEQVFLVGGKYLRNQPIILGGYDYILEENLDDIKKNDSLVISDAELGYVPGEMINAFPNLKQLGIYFSIRIKVLGPDFFDLGLEQLEAFSLFEEIRIKVLKTDVFINLPNLKELTVLNATIQELEEGVFRTNKKLESVIFEQTKISTLPEYLFAGLVDLKSVTFEMSPIKVLPVNLFLGNKFLRQLNFVNTKIEELPENLLSELFELEIFEFRRSQIKIIPENFFKNNGNLKRISLDWNKIERIPDGTFDGLHFLETVNLVNNTCIDKGFDGKLAVQTLNAELKNCQ